MKIKYGWIFSFCLVAIISIFHSPIFAFAYSDIDDNSYIELAKSNWDINSYSNVVFVLFDSPSNPGDTAIICYYQNSPINVSFSTTTPSKMLGPGGSGGTGLGGLYKQSTNTYYVYSGLIDKCYNTTDYKIYSYKGINTIGGSAIVNKAPPKLSGSDILNYNWQGNGLKIYNLSNGMKISGYVDSDNLKYFDIEAYGKFTYSGSDTFFTSYNYKKMQTSIQLSSVVTYGSLTRHAGEGLGIKSFEWVSDTSHLNKGDLIKFRVVYKVPMLDKGLYDVKIGTTINDGMSDSYISDSVSSINFLNENWEYNSPLDTSGETGNVGSQPGNQPPSSGTNGYGTTIQEQFTSLITLFSSFSGFIGSLFGFLPSNITTLFTVACGIIVALMIKRAVL